MAVSGAFGHMDRSLDALSFLAPEKRLGGRFRRAVPPRTPRDGRNREAGTARRPDAGCHWRRRPARRSRVLL